MPFPRPSHYTVNVMQYRSGNDIRETFLRFFESKSHRRVHSSSLVPANDPTLLFSNAGMNQFKDMYLGVERRDYTSATTAQKCVRAGGKHNDLENVGFTRRHHTFFEMLGNFSFGDYFKREAIAYSWELITSPEWFGIPKDRLYVTIFSGEDGVPRDGEAETFWNEIGVPSERIREYGLKDNFWQMGETGPCGPCSEIFYDLGIEAAETPGVDKPFGEDDSRYVEIWNLVFDQFDRAAVVDPATKKTTYTLTPLPTPCIDTGMGLERIAAVVQGKITNYETDLFTPLIARAAELTGVANDVSIASLRIIADHARAATFLIGDGVLPSNEGRGYVLRKILRRGIRHGRLLGQEKPFLFEMVYAVRDLMQGAYPELVDAADRVAKVIKAEEQQFARVLQIGDREMRTQLCVAVANSYEEEINRIDTEFSIFLPQKHASGAAVILLGEGDNLLNPSFWNQFDAWKLRAAIAFGPATHESDALAHAELLRSRMKSKATTLSGKVAFHLYETFGLPLDFMVDAARDSGIDFDMDGFNAAREEEKTRARASWKGGNQKTASPAFRDLPKTAFEGYHQLISTGCKVLAIVKDGAGVPAAKTGEEVEVVLDHTSFYGDSGGQVGDTGIFLSTDGNTTVAEITGCVLPVRLVRAHKAHLKQNLTVGDEVNTVVDTERRDAIRRNHTGTHLLHAALRQVLGTHVKQAGSAVDDTRLRFDFSHFSQVAEEDLQEVENIVNREVMGNALVEVFEDIPIDQAVNEFHAMALFGEKYGDRVRVIKLSDGFSTELCGGIHTTATGDIGLIKIQGESAVSSGVRRIEAITGFGSLDAFRRDAEVAQIVAQVAPAPAGGRLSDSFRAKLTAQEEELKKLRRELDDLRMKSAAGTLDEAIAKTVEVKGIRLVRMRADMLDRGQLRTLVDNLKGKLGEGVVLIASAQPEGKVALIAGVTPSLIKRIPAGKFVGAVAKLVGGSGGGKPDIAEAGGKDQAQIDAALKAAPEIAAGFLA